MSVSTVVTVRPASSAVRWARRRGLLTTATNAAVTNARLSARERSSPSGVRSRSVTDVCRPAALHSVWPCRTTTMSPIRIILPCFATVRPVDEVLVLWDVDHTLVDVDGLGREAYE